MTRFHGPGAFRDLRDAEIAAVVKNIHAQRDAHESAVMRTQANREEWMIHQVAPGLIDDRAIAMRHPDVRARAEFAKLFQPRSGH
jgi:hypothetical protein